MSRLQNRRKPQLPGALRNIGLICLGIFFLSAAPAIAGVNVPDWVRQVAAQAPGIYPPETKAVVLLDQTDYTIKAPGDYIEHSRRIVKIRRRDGREEGDLGLGLRRGGRLNYLHACTLDSLSHEYELNPNDFADRSVAYYILYRAI